MEFNEMLSHNTEDVIQFHIEAAEHCMNEVKNNLAAGLAMPSPDEIVTAYLKLVNSHTYKRNKLMKAVDPTVKGWKSPDTIPWYVVRIFMCGYYEICNLVSEDECTLSSGQVSFYDEEAGIYVSEIKDPVWFRKTAEQFRRCLTDQEFRNVMSSLKANAPVRTLIRDPHLTFVKNGIFNHKTKTLMEFSPEYPSFLRIPVNYVENPANPVIQNPDGTSWDIESWICSLSDDAEIQNLLWQGIYAIVRPNNTWDRALCLYGESGGNGKGTYIELLQNLAGEGNVSNATMKDLAKQFAPAELLTAVAILGHENQVDVFVKYQDAFKSIVTGDPFMLERKNKDSFSFAFRGLVVQCLNGFLHQSDTTDSLYRRMLMVPFDKNFQGISRPYIKSDYIRRKDVLEYVLWKALNADFDGFPKPGQEPLACRKLLQKQRLAGDPVREFWDEMKNEFVWDLLPYQFLYDLYMKWFMRSHPNSKPLSKTSMLAKIKLIAKEGGEWEPSGNPVASANRMEAPEHLIAEYGMVNWQNPLYQNKDMNRLCLPPLKMQYRGLVRVSSAKPAANRESRMPEPCM